MFVVLVQAQLFQVLQEELEDWTPGTCFAWTQISSHLPSLITSVRISFFFFSIGHSVFTLLVMIIDPFVYK